MEIGVYIRNMGAASASETITAAAVEAEKAGLDHAWVVDHIAIPPDEASGSGGRYLDPLGTLAFLAAKTQRLRLGVAVLVLPYRPALPTAKLVATIQELSGGRMLLGVGVGWMHAEFAAVGVDRSKRGAITDSYLEQFEQWFSADEATANGQPFLFKPRPTPPPLYIGGSGEVALRRCVRFGASWMPMSADPEKLRPGIERLTELAEDAGQGSPGIVPVVPLPIDDRNRAVAIARELHGLGCTGLIHGFKYESAGEFAETAGKLAEIRSELR